MATKFVILYLCIFTHLFLNSDAQNTTYLPTVLWHGMGDSCCFEFSMGRIADIIEEELPGIYVYSIMIGDSIAQDVLMGFLGNQNEHVQEACDEIAADPQLQGGFNAVGFSQGSQFLRALAQRCPDPPMNNLVSLGGQHEGVYGFPNCPPSEQFCDDLRQNLSNKAYDPVIQHGLVQAQYWHDAINVDAYVNGSIFLADINQEREVKDEYRTNLKSLANFAMVLFENDTMVIPRESQWFSFYAPGNDSVIVPLNESAIYIEDRLGLQEMDENGQLQFLSLPGNHLEFTDEWFIEEIVHVYLDTEV